MQTLDEVLQDAMTQAQRDNCHLAIDYRPGDAMPWWVGSITVQDGVANGVVSEVDGSSLQEALARWVQGHRYALLQRGVGAFAEPSMS